MKITLTLEVEPEDTDEGDRTGLTEEAFNRLSDALQDSGFGIVEGPRAQ
jgi:hypothetical protein